MFLFRDYVLPLKKEIRCSLQVIKGVGFWKSNFLCFKIGIAFPFFIENIWLYLFFVLTFFIKLLVLSFSTVYRKQNKRLNFILKIKARRSLRHRDLLPVNGQRTRSNGGTRRRLREIFFGKYR